MATDASRPQWARTHADKPSNVLRFTELIAEHPRLTATARQTVGGKGYGLVIALVTD
ncbi:hypothetical protein [Streptomyces sp. F8]|uniref:hypothetical protein n=1 Tax=Streptomyces sp. F8 TaxID=1436085 RepID=UPI003FA6FA69